MSYTGLSTISTFRNSVLIEHTTFKTFLMDYLEGQLIPAEENKMYCILDEHHSIVSRIRSTNLVFIYKKIIELVPEAVESFRIHIMNKADFILNNKDSDALLRIEDELYHFNQYFETD